MKTRQLTLREARRTISKIIAAGDTVTIAKPYEHARAFIVPVTKHDKWDAKATRAAFKKARASFIDSWNKAQEG